MYSARIVSILFLAFLAEQFAPGQGEAVDDVPVIENPLDNPLNCQIAERKVYNPCGTACPKTCANFYENTVCTEQCVETCECLGELVLDKNGKCVSPLKCPSFTVGRGAYCNGFWDPIPRMCDRNFQCLDKEIAFVPGINATIADLPGVCGQQNAFIKPGTVRIIGRSHVDGALDCLVMCKMNKNCVAWSFYNRGVLKKGKCWIFKARRKKIPRHKKKRGWISAVIDHSEYRYY